MKRKHLFALLKGPFNLSLLLFFICSFILSFLLLFFQLFFILSFLWIKIQISNMFCKSMSVCHIHMTWHIIVCSNSEGCKGHLCCDVVRPCPGRANSCLSKLRGALRKTQLLPEKSRSAFLFSVPPYIPSKLTSRSLPRLQKTKTWKGAVWVTPVRPTLRRAAERKLLGPRCTVARYQFQRPYGSPWPEPWLACTDVAPMHNVVLRGQQDMENMRKDPPGLMFTGLWLTTMMVLWCPEVAKHPSGQGRLRCKHQLRAPPPSTIETALGK